MARKPRSDRKNPPSSPPPLTPRAARLGDAARAYAPAPVYITVADACDVLGRGGLPCTGWSVRKYVRDGKKVAGFDSPIRLAATHLPGGIVFTQAQLEEFLQAIGAAKELVWRKRAGFTGGVDASFILANIAPALAEARRRERDGAIESVVKGDGGDKRVGAGVRDSRGRKSA